MSEFIKRAVKQNAGANTEGIGAHQSNEGVRKCFPQAFDQLPKRGMINQAFAQIKKDLKTKKCDQYKSEGGEPEEGDISISKTYLCNS